MQILVVHRAGELYLQTDLVSALRMLHVDDFMFFMDSDIMPLMGCMLSIFCQITQIPIIEKNRTQG